MIRKFEHGKRLDTGIYYSINRIEINLKFVWRGSKIDHMWSFRWWRSSRYYYPKTFMGFKYRKNVQSWRERFFYDHKRIDKAANQRMLDRLVSPKLEADNTDIWTRFNDGPTIGLKGMED
jgi:hypothetical protein